MSKTLVWVEHDNASVKDATLAVVTAAAQIGEVTALVAGSGCDGAAAAARQNVELDVIADNEGAQPCGIAADLRGFGAA